MPLSHPGRLPRPLMLSLVLMLGLGFLITSLLSYYHSRATIRESVVETELPLTSDTVYSEIQKDLVRPILISSMMARDTFVRDWVLAGEHDAGQMTRYLAEIMNEYGAFTAFFVSEPSHTYYQAKGVLKQVAEDEPRDRWYFRVREMSEPYEINADVDLANSDRMTFFINYRVLDYDGRFIGVTGVGLSVEAAARIIDEYQQRYERTVFFTDRQGKVTLTGREKGPLGLSSGQSIAEFQGLSQVLDALPTHDRASFEYRAEGAPHFVNVRYIPELEWYLFVDKDESDLFAAIQRTLLINLLVCLLVTVLVLLLVARVLRRYQQRIASLATTDSLTGLPNRRGFELLAGQAIAEARRDHSPLTAVVLDIDHFKALNDDHGHLAGDTVLRDFAGDLRAGLRQSDILCRWGGEEFVILFKGTASDIAHALSEKIRAMAEHKRYRFEDHELALTVSLGQSALTEADSLDSLIGRADRALYRAKQSGRNRVCIEHG
ncbi:sensor domain-containing diguanylate cyclase [Stutzerimonas tarimensis]|uniref:diguanylate cyclase n=1 Tax=Stutzerimonas tarimensis TaxID=1507735 RepID=A0ABV7T8D7_9GAMM